ncbi:tripartite tricarboxylate transporter substrate binding protein [Polaromonas sp. P2-4]|nr:tripartite tricarboxylate transporter substrate binding protein [Polaromonas sp. P2-4]
MSTCLAWTDKPVRVLVPAPAGGLMDALARVMADQLTVNLGQPIIVDDRPGAGGFIGVKAMLSAPADGQTIMFTASNVLTEIPHVLKTAFDPLKDVKPVATVALSRLVLVGSPDLPAKDLKELIAYVKANPGKLSFASYSSGTASHYAGEMLNQKMGLDLQHVPFPGAPPAIVQVLGKQVTVMFDNIANSLPMIRAGKLRAYAVASNTRSSVLPDVPTFAELGFSDFNFVNWLGVVVSSSVSPEMTGKIRAATLAAAAALKVRGRMLVMGYEPIPSQPSLDKLAEATRAEYELNAGIVKTFNIQSNK